MNTDEKRDAAIARAKAENIPPAGPVRTNVDMHLTRSGGDLLVELFSITRDDEGQEHTEDPLGEVRIAADDCVPEGYDEWFSYWHYHGHRDDYPFSDRLRNMLELAGRLGLDERGERA